LSAPLPEIDIEGGGDFYAIVTGRLGGNRLSVKLHDGRTEQAIIPGKLYKKVWLKEGAQVQINKDLEIVRMIRDTDADKNNATEKLCEVANNDNDIFGKPREDEDDDDDEEINEDNILVNPNKKNSSPSRDTMKFRTIERNNRRMDGRAFSDMADMQ